MNRLWFLLWLALLAAQVLTVRFSGASGPARRTGGAAGPPPPELLELARATNAQWEQWAEPDPPGVTEPADGAGSAALLRREEALLRLRAVEERLHARGVEARLTRELRGWVGTRSHGAGRAVSEAACAAYLAGLAEWLEPFAGDSPEGPRLERAGLLPGNSAFPLLHFEMDGEPVQLGQRLLRLWENGRPWRLEELELVRLPATPAWWLQGSWCFAPEAAP